jgi:hypothetical protein
VTQRSPRRRPSRPAPRFVELGWAAAALAAVVAVTAYRIGYARKAVYPGHADPAFFYGVAQNIRAGRGASINYVWHFLVPAPQLHHYAFDYWLPGPAWMMTIGMWLRPGLPGAIDVGICMTVLLAVAVYALTRELSGSSWAPALAAVVVIVQPGVSRFAMQTESAVYLAGFGVAAIAAAVYARRLVGLWVLAGVLTALAAMSRSEGLILTAMVGLAALAWTAHSRWFIRLGLLLLGYLPVIAPFVIANLRHFGTLFPPASSSFPFMTTYEQLFATQVPRSFANLIGGQGLRHYFYTRANSFGVLPDIMLGIVTRATLDILLLIVLASQAVRWLRWLSARRATTEAGTGGTTAVAPAPAADSATDSAAGARAVAPTPARPGILGRAARARWLRRSLGSPWLIAVGFAAGVLLLNGELAPLVEAGSTLKDFVTVAALLIAGAVSALARSRAPWWLVLPIAVILLVLPLQTLAPQNRSVIHYDNAVGSNQLRYLAQLRAEQACLGRPLVLMTRQPWEFTQATGFASVQYPYGTQAEIMAVVRKYGVTDIRDPSLRPAFADLAAATGPSGPLTGSSRLPKSSFYRFRETTQGAHC